jgi:hypothetical protein
VSADADRVLRGLFGSLLGFAERRLNTEQTWEALREAAAHWLEPNLTTLLGRPPRLDELTAEVRSMLAPVSAADVSRYRGTAVRMAKAHRVLDALGMDDPIPAEAVARSPWAVTT